MHIKKINTVRTVAYSAFTLAELLISLAVLGVISVFVILETMFR